MVKDIAGKKFGRLRALRLVDYDRYRCAIWECQCDCGSTVRVRISSLTSGNTKSCGCLMREINGQNISKRTTTHNQSRSRTYRLWAKMKERCNNPTVKSFKDYGGRGISVCDRWRNFENFYADMGECPAGMSIERIDNDKGYYPENCRWATKTEQANNTRANRVLEYSGERKTVAQWGRTLGINPKTIYTKLSKGWPVERILGGIPTYACGAE